MASERSQPVRAQGRHHGVPQPAFGRSSAQLNWVGDLTEPKEEPKTETQPFQAEPPVQELPGRLRELIAESDGAGLARLPGSLPASDALQDVLLLDHAHLSDCAAFEAFLAPLRSTEWVVYAKEPFAGPKAVLAYLSRYTHRVAVSNGRLISIGADGVTFRVKDYRIDGPGRYTTMTLAAHEFIRRFLIHVLPRGQHRLRHYGLFANGNRAANIARIRQLLAARAPASDAEVTDSGDTAEQPRVFALPCPCCGGRLIIVAAFGPGRPPQQRPIPEAIDSS